VAVPRIYIMNKNDIDSLIVEAFLSKIDLPDVEAWVRRQAQNDSIVLTEVYCIRVILDWMMDKSQEEREAQL
jgi:hypothetical protein